MKKRLPILLVFTLVFSVLLTGCVPQAENAANTPAVSSGSGQAQNTQQSAQQNAPSDGGYTLTVPGTLPLVEGEATLSAMAIPTSNVIDLPTNEMSKWVEEQTGVTFKWTIIESSAEATEKVNLIINSGEKLADILFVGLKKDQQQLYGEQGLLLPLNTLIEEHCPTLSDFYERFPVFKATSYCADGNIYTVSAWEECFHCTVSQKMYINQAWLKNLGLAIPTTTDEFADVLRAFKTQDPNGNGKVDELPMSGFINGWHSNMDGNLMNAFIYNDGQERVNVKDGKVYAAFNQPEWREGLRFYHMLMDEGLMDAQAFVQDHSTFLQLTSGDDVRVGAVQCGHHGMVGDMTKDSINEYTALPPLKGPAGVQFCGYYPTSAKIGGDSGSLSSTCSDPVLAIRLIDFLFTEEATIRTQFGVRGVDWEYNDDPTMPDITGGQALFHTFGKQPPQQATQQNQAWIHMAPFGWELRIWTGLAQVGEEGVFDLEKHLYDQSLTYIGYIPDEYMIPLSYNAETSRFISEKNALFKAYVEESFAQYVIGERDIDNDADWQSYLDDIEKMGLEEYLSTVQKAYSDTQ